MKFAVFQLKFVIKWHLLNIYKRIDRVRINSKLMNTMNHHNELHDLNHLFKRATKFYVHQNCN